MKGPLSQAWGQFLSQFSWDWFLTLTFRDWVKSFRAHRLFGYFVRDIEQAAGQPITWFRADEIGPHGGRFHIHALMGNVAHLRRMSWIDKWDELAGFARILPFNAYQGAAFYCAKYVTKQFSDWQLSDNLEAFRQHQPILPLSGPTKGKATPTAPAPKHESSRFSGPRRQQQPFPYMWDADRSERGSQISEVYRSEITRGRGGYREFFARTNQSRK
jgi:hypothetical protein